MRRLRRGRARQNRGLTLDVPWCPIVGQMQIRLDPDIAKTVRRNCEAHQRVFGRRKSFTEFANERLRDLFGKDEKNGKNGRKGIAA